MRRILRGFESGLLANGTLLNWFRLCFLFGLLLIDLLQFPLPLIPLALDVLDPNLGEGRVSQQKLLSLQQNLELFFLQQPLLVVPGTRFEALLDLG